MRFAIRSLALAFLGSITLAGVAAAGKLSINPQIAISATNQQKDDPSVSDKAKVGWMIGANARFGAMPYVSPGIYLQRTALQITGLDTLSLGEITDIVGTNSVYIPVKVGASLSGFRVFAGPSLTIITSVQDNDFGITKDDYESTHTGLEAGLGFNIAVVTIDASYEKGLSKVYKGSDAKQDVIRLLAGIQF